LLAGGGRWLQLIAAADAPPLPRCRTAGPFQVFVKTLTGKSITVVVHSGMFVEELKLKIEDKEGGWVGGRAGERAGGRAGRHAGG
jgi:hypothetical protein